MIEFQQSRWNNKCYEAPKLSVFRSASLNYSTSEIYISSQMNTPGKKTEKEIKAGSDFLLHYRSFLSNKYSTVT